MVLKLVEMSGPLIGKDVGHAWIDFNYGNFKFNPSIFYFIVGMFFSELGMTMDRI